jgi:hypothetical protein
MSKKQSSKAARTSNEVPTTMQPMSNATNQNDQLNPTNEG